MRCAVIPHCGQTSLRLRPAKRDAATFKPVTRRSRSEEHTSELQSHHDLVCRLLLEKKNKKTSTASSIELNTRRQTPSTRQACRRTNAVNASSSPPAAKRSRSCRTVNSPSHCPITSR